jgi:predicted NBD/HSP70 family sugar kinase
MKGRVLETERFRTPPTPERTMDLIAQRFAISRKRFGKDCVEGVGISARGIVNSDTGVVELGNNPDWVKVPVKEHLQSVLQAPVFVENNVRAAALAEYTFGDPEIQRSHCLLFVAVDDGAGIGIVLDGKVYHGPRMAAGEFGQMVIAATESPERSDRPGCLEKLVANPAVCERYNTLTGAGPTPKGDTTAHVRDICGLAMRGERAAIEALRETCAYLGVGIANVVWGLDADVVIVDGTMNEAWPLVAPWIAEQFPDGRELLNFRDLMLRTSALEGEATIIGAVTLPFVRLFATGEQASVSSPRAPMRTAAAVSRL